MLTWTEHDNVQKDAVGPVVKAPTAQASCEAPLDGCNRRRSLPANDPAFSDPVLTDGNAERIQSHLTTAELPDAEWLAAFPGASVRRGMPNGMRRAMHLCRAFVRAADAGDYVLAERLMHAASRASAKSCLQ